MTQETNKLTLSRFEEELEYAIQWSMSLTIPPDRCALLLKLLQQVPPTCGPKEKK